MNVMNPAAWRLSEPVPFPGVPESLTNPKLKISSQYLEPNVLIAIGGGPEGRPREDFPSALARPKVAHPCKMHILRNAFYLGV